MFKNILGLMIQMFFSFVLYDWRPTPNYFQKIWNQKYGQSKKKPIKTGNGLKHGRSSGHKNMKKSQKIKKQRHKRQDSTGEAVGRIMDNFIST